MKMPVCCECHQPVLPGDDYFTNDDNDDIVCAGCIDSYILERFDWYDIANELGFDCKVVPEEKQEEQERPVRGQLDMFGGVFGENA